MFRIQKQLVIGFWIAFLVVLPGVTQAAGSIFLLPLQSKHTLGNDFEVSVVLDTADNFAKKVDGAISFDNSIIRVESINLDDTVVSRWLVEPTFINNRGKISFVGELVNIKDEDALLMTIIFTSIRTGVSEINISAGQVVAAKTGDINIAGALGAAAVTIENPLSYGLIENEIQVDLKSATTITEEQIRLQNYSVEWLYRLLIIILVAIVIGLNWFLSRFVFSKR